jgi:hypothetical protein
MLKRPRSSRPTSTQPSGQEFIPKPPPRSSIERPKAEPIPEPSPWVPPPCERSTRPLSGAFDPGLRRLNIPYMPRPDAPSLRPERSKTLELLATRVLAPLYLLGMRWSAAQPPTP